MRKIIKIMSYFLLITLCSCSFIDKKEQPKNQNINEILKFTEDKIDLKIPSNYNVTNLSIDNFNSITTKNILISKNLAENNSYKNNIKTLLDNYYNIIIFDSNITSEETYSLFSIPMENRATKTSKNEELVDIKQNNFQRIGIMIYKKGEKYYTVGYNDTQNKPENILDLFNYDKNIVSP